MPQKIATNFGTEKFHRKYHKKISHHRKFPKTATVADSPAWRSG